MNPREEHLRNRELTLDYLTGIESIDLAKKYNISNTRCNQIIRRTIHRADRNIYALCYREKEMWDEKYTYAKKLREFKDRLIPLVHNETKNWITK